VQTSIRIFHRSFKREKNAHIARVEKSTGSKQNYFVYILNNPREEGSREEELKMTAVFQ